MAKEHAANSRTGSGFLALFQHHQLASELALAFTLFLVCIIGIVSRPENQLAAIWPANSYLLGMLLRHPHLGTLRGWAFAVAGYMLADTIMGTSLWENLTLNSCNVAAVAVAYFLLGKDVQEKIDYTDPTTFLRLLAAMLAGSLTAGFIGAMIETPRLTQEWPEKFAYWASSELVNYIALLPLMIHFPVRSRIPKVRDEVVRHWSIANAIPAAAFILSLLATTQVRGLTALAIPVPALLWCALVYHRFFVSLLSFIFIMWNLLAIGAGLITVYGDFSSRTDVMSTRLGVALVALAPLFVSTALAMQKEMSVRLRNMAERDSLTGVLNRRTFLDKAEQHFRNRTGDDTILAIVAIENLRRVNSELGHPRGDALLLRAGEILQQNFGHAQPVGRVNGDRFAICAAGMTEQEAADVARNICAQMRAESLILADGEPLKISASMGLRRAKFGESFQWAWSATELVLQQIRLEGRDGFAFDHGAVQSPAKPTPTIWD